MFDLAASRFLPKPVPFFAAAVAFVDGRAIESFDSRSEIAIRLTVQPSPIFRDRD
jgi:hypothetical protein